MNYTVDYFIEKFEATEEDSWCTGGYGNGIKSCALGKCFTKQQQANGDLSDEAKALCQLISGNLSSGVVCINDGDNPYYPQPTPKARILAALRDIKAKEKKE